MDSAKPQFANICRHLNHAAAQIPLSLAVAVQSHSGLGLLNSKTAHYDELNFAELDELSSKIAYGLERDGLKPGMKVVLMVTPSRAFFSLTFALFKAGIIPILVDPGMGVTNLKQCFIESAPDAFIGIPKAHVARKLFGWGKGSIKHLITVDDGSAIGKLVCCGTRFESLTRGGDSQNSDVQTRPSAYPIAQLKTDEMAAILFTSGSTGTPKGVVYSHGMFEAQISALKNDYGIKPGERDLATFPLFSLFGPALGMASIVPDMDASKPITANPDYLFAAIEQYQCTNMFVNPALIERLGQVGAPLQGSGHKVHLLSSIKRVISAGAPATIPSIKRFSQMLNTGVDVLNSYGATESLPISKIASHELFNTTNETDSGAGICVGKAIEGVEIEIIEITEEPMNNWEMVRPLPVNEIGEIVVKGPMVSGSYYQRDSATRAAKITDNSDDSYSARHRMGDLGYLDNTGRLWMCGRKAHRVDAQDLSGKLQRYFSIPSERIFNTHTDVKRSALVNVNIKGKVTPLICLELNAQLACGNSAKLFVELCVIAEQYPQTQGIERFLIHPSFPVDIRHNAKIFREKLAVWAQKQIKE